MGRQTAGSKSLSDPATTSILTYFHRRSRGLIPGGDPHRLRLIEFRVWERCDAMAFRLRNRSRNSRARFSAIATSA